MQSPAPSGSGAAPQITLSPIERSAFAHLFNLADPERTGIVTGDAAVNFFAKSKLPPAVLGQIWAMADSANNGFLTPPSFSVALRLIGHAQRGETITEATVKRPGPPPTMEGINLPLTAQLTGSQPPAAVNMPGVIEIKPEDRARYTRIFANSGPVGGLIDGDKAKEIFVKSKLPFDKLGAIWNLADTQARGSLDLTDFIIAMHFIQNTMNGALNSIPAALPPGLYEQARGSGAVGSRVIPSSPLAAQTTGGSASAFGTAAQRTIPASAFPATATSSAFQSPQPKAFGGGVTSSAPWDVTADEKARADQFFDGLDTSKQGRLDGAAVVPFFMQSKLTESVLAHVWDLSDITQSGSLTKDEFAVAMHLINGQLAGKPLPQELPASLVPPSMRNMNLPQAVNPQQSDTQKDLFSLMDDDPPAPTISASSAFITPSPAAPVVGSALSTIPTPAAAASQSQRSVPGPFDDDFFGNDNVPSTPTPASQPRNAAALSPTATGGSFGAAVRSPAVASPGGVASPSTPSASLGSAFNPSGDQGAEFGNKSIQLHSTQKAVTDLQSKRSGLESAVTTNAASIAELETRLATVRNQHESESKLVKDLETRQQNQNEELKKLREDLIREESELSALKSEKDELEQALMRDREDVRDMKKRMNDVQTETKSLKEQLEKLRKEARQQKGLVAISKKQLATAEGEQDKVAGEIEAVQRGEAVDSVEHATASTSAGVATPGVTSPVPPSEAVLSPAASVRSTNPFDRLGGGGAVATGSHPDTPSATAGHTPSGAALAGGAGAGAVIGGIAAVAAHHAGSNQTDSKHQAQSDSAGADPFGVPQHSSTAPSASGFDDAFAVPSQPSTAAAPGADFDDNFGDDFAASASKDPVSSSAANAAAAAPSSAFDDAFGSFDDKAATSTAASEPAVASAAGFGGATAADDSGDSPFGSGAAAASAHHDDQHEEDDSSDDEDEGPEDLEGYRRAGAGTGLVGSAADKFPEIKPDNDDNTILGAAASFGANPTDATKDRNDAEERTVPGGFGDVTTGATAPTPVGNSTTVDHSSATPATVDPTAIGSETGRTASTTSIAPVSRQMTGATSTDNSDFHDAITSEDLPGSSSGLGTAGATGVGAAALLAAGGGALAAGEGPKDPKLEAASSPVDPTDDVPLSQIAAAKAPDSLSAEPASGAGAASGSSASGVRSISPSSSIKTRRAPPPAPVRSATSASATSAATNPAVAPSVLAAEPPTSSGAAAPVRAAEPATDSSATNPFGMDDFGSGKANTSTTLDHNSGSSKFDDFDSAFEDLGPAEAVPTSSSLSTGAFGATNATSAGATAGFDDGFDNDFDSVPSFGHTSSGGAGAVGAAGATRSTDVAPTGSANAFDDFDAAFEPVSSSSGAGGVSAAPAIAHNSGIDRAGTSSNATSGFSFEDAFDPSSAGAPTTTTSTAGATTAPSVSSPIAAPGTYAPPPGPPPGVSSSSINAAAPPVPARSGTRNDSILATTPAGSGAEGDVYTGALPDDAGQVKQLCGMGFTREKVIQALEKSNYRTEKALERLLASA